MITRAELAKMARQHPALARRGLETADRDDEKALRNRTGKPKDDAHFKNHAPLSASTAISGREPEKEPCATQTDGEAISVKLRKKRTMNQTEARFAAILDARKTTGEVISWRYEGIRLKWGGDMHYTGDFIAFLTCSAKPTIYEVKGAHIYDRDLVRFKGCRAEWPEFAFEMWQWKNKTWTRIH
jgi:hypothetical protein